MPETIKNKGGRPKGSKGKRGLLKAAATTPPPPGAMRAVEIMRKAAHNLMALAGRYQPTEKNSLANEAKFVDYLGRAVDVAGRLAPYEDARKSSISIEEHPLDLSQLTDAQFSSLEAIYRAASLARGDGGGEASTKH